MWNDHRMLTAHIIDHCLVLSDHGHFSARIPSPPPCVSRSSRTSPLNAIYLSPRDRKSHNDFLFRTRLTVGHLASRTNDNLNPNLFFWWRIIFHCRDIGTARKYIKLPLAMISKLKHLNNCLIVPFFSSVSLYCRITLETKDRKERGNFDWFLLFVIMYDWDNAFKEGWWSSVF